MLDKSGSVLDMVRGLDPDTRSAVIARLMRKRWPLEQWAARARGTQIWPDGDWRCWLMLAGRGFGKTRAGAEWVADQARINGKLRIALVGATMADARAVMVEGISGVLAVSPEGARPRWEPSLGTLEWPSGALATLYSAEAPERLRGPEHHIGWCDEIAKWPQGTAAWDNLQLGLRLGAHPRVVATTTPRPVPLVRAILAAPGTLVTRGRTHDNAANLPPAFIEQVEALYGGTRLGRQEMDGELIEDLEGALWSRDLIEACRAMDDPPGDRSRSARRDQR